MSLHVEIQRHETDLQGNDRIQREKMSVGRALLIAQGRPTSDEALALADMGLAVKEREGKDYLAIALRHASLTKLFQGTRWKRDGGWTGGLREVDGVIRNYPAQMAGTRLKCTWIPWAGLGLSDDVPVAKGFGHRFPAPQQIF